MINLPVNFAQLHNVRLPTIYRQIAPAHVESFFADGTLRLSTFAAFKTHPDELRRDVYEGHSSLDLTTQHGNMMRGIFMGGPPSYILCGSTTEPTPEQLADPRSAYIKINNTIEFAHCVSRQLAGYTTSAEGACLYSADQTVRKAIHFEMPITERMTEEDMKRGQREMSTHAVDSYFRKLPKFAHEDEYRLIWFVDANTNDSIFIKAPLACQFCEKLPAPPTPDSDWKMGGTMGSAIDR